jgi:hypothetical protein
MFLSPAGQDEIFSEYKFLHDPDSAPVHALSEALKCEQKAKGLALETTAACLVTLVMVFIVQKVKKPVTIAVGRSHPSIDDGGVAKYLAHHGDLMVPFSKRRLIDAYGTNPTSEFSKSS